MPTNHIRTALAALAPVLNSALAEALILAAVAGPAVAGSTSTVEVARAAAPVIGASSVMMTVDDAVDGAASEVGVRVELLVSSDAELETRDDDEGVDVRELVDWLVDVVRVVELLTLGVVEVGPDGRAVG